MTELYGKDGEKNPVFKRVHDTIGGGQIYTLLMEKLFSTVSTEETTILQSTVAVETESFLKWE